LTGTGLTRTYTAPPVDVPSPNPAVIKVASAADPSKFKTADVTVTTSIVVKITSPTLPPTLHVGGTVPITASLTGSTNTLVTWSVNGVTNGDSTYGTISGSGFSVTYHAPDSVPSLPTFNIKVASQADPSKSATLPVTISGAAACTSSGNDAVLKGRYAFHLGGFNDTGFLAIAGAFTANGAGGITAGEADTNGALGAHESSITTTASSYSVGSDNRGCATLVTSFGTFVTRFALGAVSAGVATDGQIMEWGEATASAYVASGEIMQQDTAEFAGGLSGSYAHRDVGWDSSVPGRLACAGTRSVSAKSFSAIEEDCNDAGTVTNATGGSGSYTSFDANGRATETVDVGGSTRHFALYMVNTSYLYGVNSDTNPVLEGILVQQTVPAGGFVTGSVHGTIIYTDTGILGTTEGYADFGVASANGTGSLSVTEYDFGGGASGTKTKTCNYAVSKNGRTILSGTSCGSNPDIVYLTSLNTGLVLGVNDAVRIGSFAPQTGGPAFDDGSLSGTYFLGTAEIVNHNAEAEVGIAKPSGSGSLPITSDTTSITTQTPDATRDLTYTVNSNGTITTTASGTTIVGAVISDSEFLLIDPDALTKLYPILLVGHK
jgi:hypothetical protein